MPQYTLNKSERITSRLLQDQLFQSKDSKAITSYPIKAVFLRVDHHEDDAPVQILVSVPKRLFKRAVKRNRIKRQIREAYRLNKAIIPATAPTPPATAPTPPVTAPTPPATVPTPPATAPTPPATVPEASASGPSPQSSQLLIAFIYMSDRLYPTPDIEARVRKILTKIAANHDEHPI